MQTNTSPVLSDYICTANSYQLLDLLKNADVSVGHFWGRLINVPGYRGSVSFTNFVKRVEEIYQVNVHSMQERQKEYEKSIKSSGGPGGIGLITSIIGSGIKWGLTPYPEISEQEEAIVASAIEWREGMDTEFKRLYITSQDKLDQMASEKCGYQVVQIWDSFLDTEKRFKSTSIKDKKTLEFMTTSRERHKKQATFARDAITLYSSIFSDTSEKSSHQKAD
jgi:hypothetical protein